MGKFVAEVKTIASVYPLTPLEVHRPFGSTPHGGWSIYKINPCFRGSKPTLLKISDAWQALLDPLTRERAKPDLIFAEAIANDVLTQWVSAKLLGTPPGSGPGIWICAGDEPTDSEIKEALNRQTIYFDWLFYEAQKLAASPSSQDWNKIGEEHRAAAIWLGKEEAWVKGRMHNDIKHCPACRSQVDPAAFLCANCHFPVRPMPPEMQKQFQSMQQVTGTRNTAS